MADSLKVGLIIQDEGKEEVSRRERRRQRLMAKIVMLERNYFTEGGAWKSFVFWPQINKLSPSEIPEYLWSSRGDGQDCHAWEELLHQERRLKLFCISPQINKLSVSTNSQRKVHLDKTCRVRTASIGIFLKPSRPRLLAKIVMLERNSFFHQGRPYHFAHNPQIWTGIYLCGLMIEHHQSNIMNKNLYSKTMLGITSRAAFRISWSTSSSLGLISWNLTC